MSFFQTLLSLFLGQKSETEAGVDADMVAGGSAPPGASVVAILSPFGDPAVDGPEGSMMRALGMRSELAVRPATGKITLAGEGPLASRIAAAADTAREMAFQENADIVIWGAVSPESGDLNIRLLPLRTDPLTKPGAVGLGDLLRLPTGFSGAIGDLVYAAVLATVQPRNELHQREITGEMAPLLHELDSVFSGDPPGLSPNQAFSALATFANCQAAMAGRTRDSELMNTAAENFQRAIDMPAAASLPLDTGMAQSHRAACYMALADYSREWSYLTTAAEAFESAAELFGEEHEDDWALAMMNRGHVLSKHGTNDNDSKTLQAAIHAYADAVKVFTRNRSPLRWAEIMNSQGVTLAQLAEDYSGTALAEQAVECFMKALEVRRRESAPALWAASQNNLGAALFSLGKQTGDNSMLQRSVNAFRGAVEVYQELGATNNVHVLQKNVGRVERLLESRGGAAAGGDGEPAVEAPADDGGDPAEKPAS
jgi:tetratricopeptide (TPR) repeat protein